jgi:hypothetical protein
VVIVDKKRGTTTYFCAVPMTLVSTSFNGLSLGGRGGPRSRSLPFAFFLVEIEVELVLACRLTVLPAVFLAPESEEVLLSGGSTSVSFFGLGSVREKEKELEPDIVLAGE